MGVSKADTVKVNGLTAPSRYGDYFDCPVTVGGDDRIASSLSVTCLGTTTGQTPTMLTKHLVVPPRQQSFQYDLDGNLTSDGLWSYTWDAENRLSSMCNVDTAGLTGANRLKLDFSYDFMGRRSKKTVSVATSSTTWALVNAYYYVYDLPADGEGTGSWNLAAILDANGALLRNFVWGQDLSGNLTGAGGIGGLLWVSDVSTLGQLSTHFAAYDGNGNVTALVNAANRATTARYEYSPFGQLLRATGPMAMANPFRFSTKFWDDETGLVYYGYRYYSPTLGRWIGRDPAEENGGINLYAFVKNKGINTFDIDGRSEFVDVMCTMGINGIMGGMCNAFMKIVDNVPRNYNPDANIMVGVPKAFMSGFVAGAVFGGAYKAVTGKIASVFAEVPLSGTVSSAAFRSAVSDAILDGAAAGMISGTMGQILADIICGDN